MGGKELQKILQSSAAYAAALGPDPAGGIKLYPSSQVPQGTARPYATYTRVSRVEDQNKDSRGIYTVYLQIDHFATTVDKAEQLDRLCVEALNRFSGVVEGTKIKSIRVISGHDGYSPQLEANSTMSEFTVKINP